MQTISLLYRKTASIVFWKMLFVPPDGPIDAVHHMLGFAQAMSLAGIAHKNRFHTDILERDVELLRFGYRHVSVILAVHQHDRRMHLGDVFERRALPEQVHQIALVR